MTSPETRLGVPDKRASVRIDVAFPAEYRVTGSEQVRNGQVTELSAGGFSFESERKIEPGTGIAITLRSPDSEIITAAWVLRCSAIDSGCGYRVACAFDG